MKTRVYVDMDGVLADFDKKKEELALSGDVAKKQKGFYISLEPIPKSIESVRKLIDFGYDVWIATKPPTGVAHAYSEKAEWIYKYLPELKRNIIITHDKGTLGTAGDFIIDDRIESAYLLEFEGIIIDFTQGGWQFALARLGVG